jgi:hypothetical protein
MTLAAIRHHRLFPRFAILAGGASALAIGVLTVGVVLSTTSDARTASTPTFSTFERVVEAPEMLAIMPSPVIDISGQFFFRDRRRLCWILFPRTLSMSQAAAKAKRLSVY